MSETPQVPSALYADLAFYSDRRKEALAQALAIMRDANTWSAKLTNAFANAEQYGVNGVEEAQDVATEVRAMTEQIADLSALAEVVPLPPLATSERA